MLGGAVGSDVRNTHSSLPGWRGANRELISQGRVMSLFTRFDVLREIR